MPSRPTGTSIKSHTARVAVYLGTRLNVIDATIHLRYLHVTVQLRKETGMRRRDILAGAGSLAAGATLSFPAPAIAQGIRQLKMVTDWPAGSPGLQSSAARLAQRIGTASDGRITSRYSRPARSFARSRPSTRSGPASLICITRASTIG